MPCLINIYNDILKDFSKEIYNKSKVLSRSLKMKGGTILLISVYRESLLAEISLSIYNDDCKSIGKLPKWKGMDERVSFIKYGQGERLFISFRQSKDYDQKIYFTIIQDIVNEIKDITEKDMIYKLKEVLYKWSTFFEFEKEYVLSNNAQQGLYSELYILENMISVKDSSIVNCWTGCNSEDHDFYIGKNAVEIKSSAGKRPNKIKINNEYQLDTVGINGKLYLLYIELRKSEVYGENLPTIVDRIMEKLNPSEIIKFKNKLIKVGYLYQLPELYKINFIIKGESCYNVIEGFPRITKDSINKGIGSVSYMLSLDTCEPFLMTIEDFYKEVLF